MNAWPLVSSRFPFVPILLQIRDQSFDVEALIDTGFNGDVVLPVGMIADHTEQNIEMRWRLADGTQVIAPGYFATLRIGPVRVRPVVVTAIGDVPMIGRGLVQHFRITLDHGERVVVEP